MKPLTVIGLNSGTSMDGIDAAVYRISPKDSLPLKSGAPNLKAELLGCLLYEFEPQFRGQLQKLVASGGAFANLEQLSRLNVALGEIFAQAARAVMKSTGLTRSQVDLIGCHGQTIWHAPQERKLWGVKTRASWQMGEASVIAEATKVPVVADFRALDMAYGGQGAPLVPFADEVIFGELNQAVGVLNLGGIANITVLDKTGSAVQAFDTGPANMLIDSAAQLYFNCAYDEGGRLAASGKTNHEWLEELLRHPYLQLSPPKSTGREEFGQQFFEQLRTEAESRQLSPHDFLHTLTSLSAASIAQGYERFIRPANVLNRLILGGGGAENHCLTALLSQHWPDPLQLEKHEDHGVSSKFKEALLFALLAYTNFFGIANNVPACTGARHKVCLGKLTRAQ